MKVVFTKANSHKYSSVASRDDGVSLAIPGFGPSSRVATVAGAGTEPAARHGCARDMSPRSGASRHGGRGWAS
jgi:hypothetical protein